MIILSRVQITAGPGLEKPVTPLAGATCGERCSYSFERASGEWEIPVVNPPPRHKNTINCGKRQAVLYCINDLLASNR
jgi:hypothetical protein